MDVGRGLPDAVAGHRALLPERTLCRLRHGVLLSVDDGVWLLEMDPWVGLEDRPAHPSFPLPAGIAVDGADRWRVGLYLLASRDVHQLECAPGRQFHDRLKHRRCLGPGSQVSGAVVHLDCRRCGDVRALFL